MAKKLPREMITAIEQIAIGNYDSKLAQFDERAFSKNWHIPFLVVFGFLRRFSLREFHIVHGDPLIAMVASEIWLYNITRTLLRDGGIDTEDLEHDSVRQVRFARCNAYSISQFLGVPAETVRRKVKALIEMGWVDKSENGQLAVTRACEDAFNPGSNLETMHDFIATARTLFRTMGLELTVADAPSIQSTGVDEPR